jgi:glycosyltransferase involved in cell wall biosynthesis
MAIVAARAAGVQLVIAGTGPEEGRLRSLADDSVKFVGHLPADQLSELRSRAAVALVPSRCEEHCPYAVLEALAAGLPVLASDRGGLPELVGEDAAVAADDLEAWTTALQTLWRDPELRSFRGRDALARARDRFGEDRHYTGLLAVYGDHH